MASPSSAPDLQELYRSLLKPRLEALEGERLKLRSLIVAAALLVGLPALGFVWSDGIGRVIPEGGRPWVAPVCFVLIFIGAGVAAMKCAMPGITAYLNYRARFKRDIVAEIIKAVSPGALYAPDRSITEAIFDASGVFAKRGSFSGDDLVRGRIGRTPFEACELQRQYTEGSGKNETTRVIFHGLFFHLDFNKTIRGRTIVAPRGTESWRLGPRDDLARVTLEDPEFEKAFEVSSTSQVEARYILTPLLMEHILDIHTKTGKPIFLAFAANSAYVAVHFGCSLFEPSIAETTSFEALAEMADHFGLAATVVQELDLNTRIWTKDVDASLLETAPDVSPLESLSAGDLKEEGLYGQLAQMAGQTFEDANKGPRPEPPDRTRAWLERDADGLSVHYRLAWWFVPFLLIALATALVAAVALCAMVNGDLVRLGLATIVTADPSTELVEKVRWGLPFALAGALIVGALPAWATLAYVRRVHIGRGEIRVWRGLRPLPRRYPITDQSRIRQLDTVLSLGHANQFTLVGVSLAPALHSALEARWVAWEMRRAMDEAGRTAGADG